MKNFKKILIFGAGEAGIQLAAGLLKSNKVMIHAFIDDNPKLQGSKILGIKVFNRDYINIAIENENITDVLIAMPSLGRMGIRDLINFLTNYPVYVKSLPSLDELIGNKITIDDLRDVSINDILGRDNVCPNIEILSKNTLNKTILVTGAGGSIGSELCRQLIKYQPKKIILIDNSEHALFTINNELIRFNTISEVVPILIDITHESRLSRIFESNKIEIVYHAAAYKHVPLVEDNIISAIENNIIGTYIMSSLSIANSVKKFILISTDKAVRPTNVMGATKRVSELIIQGMNNSLVNNKTKLSAVRFGNVLNSSGSVVPIFQEQINKGGPVTVTDAEIVRFFMTIPEAAQLVIQAVNIAEGGDILLLDMGKPVKILELAKKMISLNALTLKDKNNLNGDIEISITGLRPGEKLYEELLIDGTQLPTMHDKIFRGIESSLDLHTIEKKIIHFKDSIDRNDSNLALRTLIEMVDGYKPSSYVLL
jgi:FlaA1/EpsC-like NDP-sugar epimerase